MSEARPGHKRLSKYGFTLISVTSDNIMNINSTLVETVSINLEDFNESFLTCPTCLSELLESMMFEYLMIASPGSYNGGDNSPKLLQCSHTLCLQCLTKLLSSQGCIQCPICRERIQLPAHAGVSGLPPSFMVNQLLEMMRKQRRDVVKRCVEHQNQVSSAQA